MDCAPVHILDLTRIRRPSETWSHDPHNPRLSALFCFMGCEAIASWAHALDACSSAKDARTRALRDGCDATTQGAIMSRITSEGWSLQATSGTVEGIQGLIRRFWCDTSNRYTVDPETLAILRDGAPFSGNFRVTRKGRRLRFEARLCQEARE